MLRAVCNVTAGVTLTIQSLWNSETYTLLYFVSIRFPSKFVSNLLLLFSVDPRHQFASRLNARWQTDWAIEDQTKNLNSTARPYDQRGFSPLGPTVSWLSHLALAIYMFVVVNFDALAQASDIQIERRQVVFLCWKQDLNPGPQTPIRQQTECSLLSIHVYILTYRCIHN